MYQRRDVLRQIAYGMAAVPLISACGGDSAGTPDGNAIDAPSGDEWARGGTAAMTQKASYPDPFAAGATSCVLVATTTEGPCTTATDLAREDVSEGWTGIPVRLAFKVVDSACNPLVGATVKIWHTNITGSYSGQTPNNAFCVLQPAFASMDFMRGVQTTAANGTVFFDTCFPGWYRGRAIHIHFQVKQGATSTRVSQLFFPEDVTQAIFAKHSEYVSFGQPDTTFANDSVMAAIAASERARHVADVARMPDGAMLASKIVTVV